MASGAYERGAKEESDGRKEECMEKKEKYLSERWLSIGLYCIFANLLIVCVLDGVGD